MQLIDIHAIIPMMLPSHRFIAIEGGAMGTIILEFLNLGNITPNVACTISENR
jgi:hypothetical protein